MVDQQVTTKEILEAMRRRAPAMPAMEAANIGFGSFGQGMKSLFNLMQKRTTQGFPPAKDWTNEEAKEALTLGPGMLTPGLFESPVSALGAAGGKLAKTKWTPEMQKVLLDIHTKNKGLPNSQELTAAMFKARYPEYQGSANTINRIASDIRLKGGTNIEGGAISSVLDPGSEFKLGAFGGRGKLTNPNPIADNMEWLQSKRPVDPEFLRQWAKDADIKMTERTSGPNDTQYFTFHPENKNIHPKARIPGDEEKHFGSARPGEILLDTGLGYQSKGTNNIFPLQEQTLLNRSNMPYADREAMDAALKYYTHKAPHPTKPGEGNWLIPEELGPKQVRVVPAPQPRLPTDTRQGVLDFSTEDILNALKRQQNGP